MDPVGPDLAFSNTSFSSLDHSDYSALEANILLLGQLLVFSLVLAIGLSFYLGSVQLSWIQPPKQFHLK